MIDNAVVILHVIRDGEHKLLLFPEKGSTSHSSFPATNTRNLFENREACWLSTPLATSNLQSIVAV